MYGPETSRAPASVPGVLRVVNETPRATCEWMRIAIGAIQVAGKSLCRNALISYSSIIRLIELPKAMHFMEIGVSVTTKCQPRRALYKLSSCREAVIEIEAGLSPDTITHHPSEVGFWQDISVQILY